MNSVYKIRNHKGLFCNGKFGHQIAFDQHGKSWNSENQAASYLLANYAFENQLVQGKITIVKYDQIEDSQAVDLARKAYYRRVLLGLIINDHLINKQDHTRYTFAHALSQQVKYGETAHLLSRIAGKPSELDFKWLLLFQAPVKQAVWHGCLDVLKQNRVQNTDYLYSARLQGTTTTQPAVLFKQQDQALLFKLSVTECVTVVDLHSYRQQAHDIAYGLVARPCFALDNS